jgi:opacity protein-like surface antigen
MLVVVLLAAAAAAAVFAEMASESLLTHSTQFVLCRRCILSTQVQRQMTWHCGLHLQQQMLERQQQDLPMAAILTTAAAAWSEHSTNGTMWWSWQGPTTAT